MIAKIAVSAAIYAIDKPYDYRIPEGMYLQPGQRVSVPFGRSNKRTEGMVLLLSEGDETKLKPIEQVLDPEPILDRAMLQLAIFLTERYFCTFYDALKAILPAGVWFQERCSYTVTEANWQEHIHRQPTAQAVMQTLADLGGSAQESVLRKQFDEESLEKALKYLLKRKLISCQSESRRRTYEKTEQIAVLVTSNEETQQYANSKKKAAPMQSAILELMMTLGECAVKELCYFTGASAVTVRRLASLGYLRLYEQPRLRIDKIEAAQVDTTLRLNAEQRTAYEGICASKGEISLLYGVTGSGKTSVYLKLIYDCLARNEGAILLVPEIALTPQLLSLFAAHFGEKAAVLHSSLRITQRYDTYLRIARGQATVVLGTRSAIFAPVQNLSLVIVDEEQEHTYKSENSPRYDAREVAIYRAKKAGASVVFGSATPSVETMYRANTGVYRLFTLKNRFNRQPLPQVEIVDMKQELKNGNATAISGPLLDALLDNCSAKQQSILFLNRRGTSRMVACVDCGYVPTCPGCSVNLTYHHANGRLMCHYCGNSQPLPTRCPECGGHLKQLGFGTQKVQQQLEMMLPGQEVLRMDADTVSAVHTHDKLLGRFRDEQIPILLGTQMVAKGLNFENVTLVGVVDADMSLYVPSYRAAETTFSMITQVIGRAGRGSKNGRALIQTMTPKNQVIALAARQDYDAFYDMELPLRRLRGCPPYMDLLTLTFHSRFEELSFRAAQFFKSMLTAHLKSEYYREEQVNILGPAPAQVAKLNYVYRCRLTLSCKNTRSLRQLLAQLMRQMMKDKNYRGIGVYLDVNANE
ncbi:MAG: primosomal protein N' [Ruminococcaceae bacterium]|nr:primosomal protein N' [Oscillospiraceae bacterium]